jgi:hypothetical protein
MSHSKQYLESKREHNRVEMEVYGSILPEHQYPQFSHDLAAIPRNRTPAKHIAFIEKHLEHMVVNYRKVLPPRKTKDYDSRGFIRDKTRNPFNPQFTDSILHKKKLPIPDDVPHELPTISSEDAEDETDSGNLIPVI